MNAMKNIEIAISEALDQRIKSHAKPLEDTYESVISRAFDALEQASGVASDAARPFNPAKAPSLTFTKPLSIVLNGEELDKSDLYWNNLMYAVVRQAALEGVTGEQLNRLMVVNSTVGEKNDHGYQYVPEAKISVQGQDANGAWKQIYALATAFDFSVNVVWAWNENDKAALPGQKGSFTIPR
jgi:hypothetical protein